MQGHDGRVAAILCAGSNDDRTIAMALAEAGVDIALGTLEGSQEFAVASIANEVWAVGREQFSSVLEADDPVALAAFAAETADRLGRCDVLVVCSNSGTKNAPPPEEISAEEWAAALRIGLTIPLLAAHAFQPVIERDGGGLMIFVGDDAESGLVDGVLRAGRRELAARVNEAWGPRGVRVILLSTENAAREITSMATGA